MPAGFDDGSGAGAGDDGGGAAAESGTKSPGGGSSRKASRASKKGRGTNRRSVLVGKAPKKKAELTLAQKLKQRATKYANMRKKEKQTAGGGFAKKRTAAVGRARGSVASTSSAGGAAVAAAATDAAAATEAEPAAAEAEPAAAEPDAALPENWSEAVDPGSGSTYYYNSVTQESESGARARVSRRVGAMLCCVSVGVALCAACCVSFWSLTCLYLPTPLRVRACPHDGDGVSHRVPWQLYGSDLPPELSVAAVVLQRLLVPC